MNLKALSGFQRTAYYSGFATFFRGPERTLSVSETQVKGKLLQSERRKLLLLWKEIFATTSCEKHGKLFAKH